jgi:hypothetical protein
VEALCAREAELVQVPHLVWSTWLVGSEVSGSQQP